MPAPPVLFLEEEVDDDAWWRVARGLKPWAEGSLRLAAKPPPASGYLARAGELAFFGDALHIEEDAYAGLERELADGAYCVPDERL